MREFVARIYRRSIGCIGIAEAICGVRISRSRGRRGEYRRSRGAVIWFGGLGGFRPPSKSLSEFTGEKISVDNMRPRAQNLRFYFPHGVKAL